MAAVAPRRAGDSPKSLQSAIIIPSRTFQIAMDQPDFEQMRRKLAELKSEHRDLDDVIAQLSESPPFDQLQLQRLKKRKLSLKDQILKLEDALLPDIIA